MMGHTENSLDNKPKLEYPILFKENDDSYILRFDDLDNWHRLTEQEVERLRAALNIEFKDL